MDIAPFLNAPISIQVHVVCAVVSLALVPLMVLRRKGDRLHKVIGRVWAIAMALTALSSFAIMTIRIIGPSVRFMGSRCLLYIL